MNFLQGNLITLAQQGHFDAIAQGCNCKHSFGAGLAKAIKQAFPQAYQADLKTPHASRRKLGTVSYAQIDNLIVINCYTQFDYGRDPNKLYVDYNAVRSCMRYIRQLASGKRIGLPKIGAGLANGSWNIIQAIIQQELPNENITIVSL